MNIKFLIVLLLYLITTACSVEQEEAKKGPENSWWLGGADGGAYIKIEEDNNTHDNLYQGVVFFENDKTVWYRGPFKLVGDLKFSVENHDLYLFWDGEKIHLQQGSYLEAVNPVPLL
ncbi:MAG TPA: hypothetical protein VN451_04880 [Chitinophagaceae bacterium]|nr:hypothetical protein [Chitinophagaceae bacterium]